MTRNYGLTLVLTLFTAISLFGQDPGKFAEFQFVNSTGFDCENTPMVCFDLQIRSSVAEPFRLYGINNRMFFDMSVLEWVSTTSSLDNNIYPFTTATVIEDNAVNSWDMGLPMYLRFDQRGIDSPVDFIYTEITNAWTTYAVICFNMIGTPPDTICPSLVWDKFEDFSMGWQDGNDGIEALEQVGGVQAPLAEEVIQYNWDYLTNTTGEPNELTQCIPTECEPPVSVDLISFNAKRADKSSVLNWVTTNEIDNDYFEVQRSADGQKFEVIGKVQAAENPSDINQYNFVDHQPIPGRNYYRLNQIDLDGTAELTYIRSVDFFEGKLKISTFPNPTTDIVFVDLGLEDANASREFEIKLLDLDGKEIQVQEVNVEAASRVKLDLTELASGTYIVKVVSGEIERNEKIVKID